jgi:TIR domain
VAARRFQHGYANDVYISSAPQDEQTEAGDRWMAKFSHELRLRLEEISGRAIRMFRLDRMADAGLFSAETEQQLLMSAIFVPIITPSYVRSERCTAERLKFIGSADGERGLARVVPVVKTPVPRALYPEDIGQRLQFPFYVHEENGRAREFHLSSSEETQRGFHTRVDDVAHSIAEILNDLEADAGPLATAQASANRLKESARKPRPRQGAAKPPNASTALRRIFLCYRRDDSGGIVGRIYDRLVRDYGEENVFKDVDNIPFGVDFVEHLDREVQKCDALFVVIGRSWLGVAPDLSRLDDPNDFVRIEIASALRRAIPVVPLLVDGAQMPSADQLPAELRLLARRHGTLIRHDPDFHIDITRLLSRLPDREQA